MYRNDYDKEFGNEVRFGKKLFLWLVGVSLVLGALGWFATRSERVVDAAILSYEDFHEIHRTCEKLDSDLATLRAVPEEDRMFAAFSKAAMIAGKRQQMTRWVEEYNAKSKMWNRSMWKSDALPYQLRAEDFPNYGGAP